MPGVWRTSPEMSLTPRLSSISCEKALTLSGTLLIGSAWRVAVTTISPAPASAALVEPVCASADVADDMAIKDAAAQNIFLIRIPLIL